MLPLVILAGGLGTRLRAVTGDGPKVLAEVARGVPMLRHLLRHWQARGARRVVLCLGYRADDIAAAVPTWSELGLDIIVSRESAPLGTGGAIRNALEYLPERFFVANGDTVVDVSLAALERWRRSHEFDGALLVNASAASREGDGIVVAPDRSIAAFSGRTVQDAAVIYAGVAVLPRRAFATLPAGTPVNLESGVLAPAVADGIRLGALCTVRHFHDLGTPERLTNYSSRATND
jgi:NDP-sugar pyrophosphorylase family protein